MLSGSEPKSYTGQFRIRTEFGGHLFAWALLNHTDGYDRRGEQTGIV